MVQKIKQFIESETGKDILVVLVVILVGLGAFELGRLSRNGENAGIKVEYPEKLSTLANQSANVASAATITKSTPTPVKKVATSTGKNFFASSRGSKYYPVTCSAGKTIKPENRVYFDSRTDAEAAGYELSSSCK